MANGLPNLNLTPQQQQALLETASKKLGIDRSELEKAVNSGRFDSLQKHAGPELSRYLGDPKALEQLLSNPQAQAALKKMMGG